MLGNLLRIREDTGEVGAAQGRAQLLQHQSPLQPSARTPALPAGGALPQPAWEVLDEGTIAQPVEDAEGEAAASSTGQGQRSIQWNFHFWPSHLQCWALLSCWEYWEPGETGVLHAPS